MKAIVTPNVIGTVTKRLEKLVIRGWVEPIQISALLRSARLEENCCHSLSGETLSANLGGKNSQKNEIRELIFIYCGLLVLILVVFVFFCAVSSQIKKPHLKMIPIKDKYKNSAQTRLEDQIRIYKTKKSIFDRPSGPVAQRIEALSLYGSRWALSENSGFKSYPSRPEVYLVKNVVR